MSSNHSEAKVSPTFDLALAVIPNGFLLIRCWKSLRFDMEVI